MSSVLIVDDVADIRLLCRIVLERAGHDVTEAGSALEALSVLREVTPDYMVLDIRMPGMSGWELLDQVRQVAALERTKVIVCSAHAGPAEERRALVDGANAFLAKPFTPLDLLAAIGRATPFS